MSHGATVRFETLRDRIRQYALSEIQECIDEKEALVQVVCVPILSRDPHLHFGRISTSSE